MGHSSKFVFPLPGRKQKPVPAAPTSGPWTTKAQRILGSSEFSDHLVQPGGWETQSNSGISIAVTETTQGEPGHGRTQNEWATTKALGDRRWEQESEIIPAVLNRPHEIVGSLVPDGATDASSLRRRQSSSTITSFYDKAKLPLSISQQTSNSAMAKGLPSKAQALLDIDGEFNEPPQLKKARKKPSRLDLSALLQKHRTPKQVHAAPSKSQLRVDSNAKSASSTSLSSAPTPPPPQRSDHAVRKRATMESIRENATHQSSQYGSVGRLGSRQGQPNKASADLYHLYDHYEQRTFADAMDQELQGSAFHVEPPSARRPPSQSSPPAGQTGKAYLSPFPPNVSRNNNFSKPSPLGLTAAELRRAGAGSPSSPVLADCASVSSRHTRTSKASKRTDRSLQEIDLLQNSVLALSSDSEDDYELSSKGSLAVPTLSDGQASPSSPRSPVSQMSVDPYERSRGKPVKRTSFAPHPQLLTDTQGFAAPKGLKISPRTSSLNSKASAASGQPMAHETSRLSTGTTSTGRTIANASPSLNAPPAANKAPRKMRSESQFDFPAPPVHRGSRSASVSRASDQANPTSPTSVDLYLQSQLSPAATENGSIRSGASLGSAANGGRRGSATSSLHDGNSGRFMAVTRQEEMLLAALRMKRQRMRENIIAEFEEEAQREEHHQLSREITNESMAPTGGMSRQSSRSTMRQDTGTLSARPRHQTQGRRSSKDNGDQLRIVIEHSQYDPAVRTPGSEISDFIHFDDSFGSAGLERKDSKASSIGSQRSGSSRQRASLSAMAAPAPRRSQRRDGSSSRRNSDQVSTNGQMDLPHQIPEDPAEDEEVGIPRPDSPISPADFPAPVSIKNNKQVRLSAVGFYKPGEAGW